MNAQGTQSKKKRVRSPAYPFFSLKDCISFVVKLHKQDGLGPVHREIALKHMGQDPKKNLANRALSSMTGFGLLDERGTGSSRVVQPSELSKRILLDKRETSLEKTEALRSAALRYEIIRNLKDKWPHGLPSDESIETTLLLDIGFNERAVGRFVSVFRETYDFANLEGGDILPGEEHESIVDTAFEDAVRMHASSTPRLGAEMREYTIPLIRGTAILKAQIPMSEDNHTLIMKWLEDFKEALTYSLEDVDVEEQQEADEE